MGPPNYKNKYKKSLIFSSKILAQNRKESRQYPSYSPPKGIIFCYSNSLFQDVKKDYKLNKKKGFFGEFYYFSKEYKDIGIIGNFGIGAPISAILMEDFFNFGVKNFISIGSAGSLQESIIPGSIVLCDKALRDEGTSFHYKPAEKFAYPSKKLKKVIINNMNDEKVPFFLGSTWTTDAPYRETLEEVQMYKKEGISAVDMESSALFTVAETNDVHVVSIFVITDTLYELVWKPTREFKIIRKNFKLVLKTCLTALINL